MQRKLTILSILFPMAILTAAGVAVYNPSSPKVFYQFAQVQGVFQNNSADSSPIEEKIFQAV
jgi:hypothetical protein